MLGFGKVKVPLGEIYYLLRRIQGDTNDKLQQVELWDILIMTRRCLVRYLSLYSVILL